MNSIQKKLVQSKFLSAGWFKILIVIIVIAIAYAIANWDHHDDVYEHYIDPVIAISTLLVAIAIYVQTYIQELKRGLPKVLTVHYKLSNGNYVLSCYNTDLTDVADIRAWSQQVGKQMGNDDPFFDLSLLFDVDGPEVVVLPSTENLVAHEIDKEAGHKKANKNKGKIVNRYEVVVYLKSDKDIHPRVEEGKKSIDAQKHIRWYILQDYDNQKDKLFPLATKDASLMVHKPTMDELSQYYSQRSTTND